MKKWLNPFVYVSGERALAYGLVVTILTAVLAWQCDILTKGVLAFEYGHELLWKATARLLITWALPALLLYGAALLLSKSKIRAVDVVGMNLLARAVPVAALVLLSVWMAPSLRAVQDALVAQEGVVSAELLAAVSSLPVLLGGVLSVVCLVWYFVWNYRAYALAANLKGWSAVASFIVCILAADVASRWVLALL